MGYENMFCDLQPEHAVRDATGFAKEKKKQKKCMLTTFADANK